MSPQVVRQTWHRAVRTARRSKACRSVSSMSRSTTSSSCSRSASSSCARPSLTAPWPSSETTLKDWKRWWHMFQIQILWALSLAGCSRLTYRHVCSFSHCIEMHVDAVVGLCWKEHNCYWCFIVFIHLFPDSFPFHYVGVLSKSCLVLHHKNGCSVSVVLSVQ